MTVTLIAVATYAVLCMLSLFGMSVREQYCGTDHSTPTQRTRAQSETLERSRDVLGSVELDRNSSEKDFGDCSYNALVYLNGLAFLFGGVAFGFSMRPGDRIEGVLTLPVLFVLVSQGLTYLNVLTKFYEIFSLPLEFVRTWEGIVTYSITTLLGGYLSKY